MSAEATNPTLWPNVDTAAQELVALYETPPNAWGRHNHPVHGDSGNMLLRITRAFGTRETHAALDKVFSTPPT